MKILLINPPITRHESDPLAGEAGNLPLGLCYIAAYLKKNNYEVRVLDAMAEGVGNIEKRGQFVRTGLSEEKIEEAIREFNPQVVGITTMFTSYAQDSHDIAKLVKRIDNNILVVLGGVHATACYDMVFSDKNVDIVVKGEGEITIVELMRALEKKEAITGIPGTIVRSGGELLNNADRPFIEDLDRLPFPQREFLPVDVYLRGARLSYCMRQPVMGMVTSRGCPCRCSYCGIHAVWKHTWRARSAANVADEIEYLIRLYGAKEFHFLDDSISADKQRMHEICDEIIKRKLDIRWTTPNGIAIWTLDELLLKKMRKSGCYRLTFGIESGNEPTQRFIGKIIKFEHANRIIKAANSLGMWTLATFIIGFPYETREEIFETIEFSKKLDIDIAFYNVLMPFPTTRVYEIFHKEGLLPVNRSLEFFNAFTGKGGGCDTKLFKKEELAEFSDIAHREFYRSRIKKFMNPFRIMNKIRSWESAGYVFTLLKGVISYSTGEFETKSNPEKART
ncbi:MAG: radical SAM protein [Candidatus Omnitrophota bacterium]